MPYFDIGTFVDQRVAGYRTPAYLDARTAMEDTFRSLKEQLPPQAQFRLAQYRELTLRDIRFKALANLLYGFEWAGRMLNQTDFSVKNFDAETLYDLLRSEFDASLSFFV